MSAHTWLNACANRGPNSMEFWVHAELIDDLLMAGWDPLQVHYEYRITPSDIVDVLVLTDRKAIVFECKLQPPKPQFIRQTIRYVHRAVEAWPDREVYGFLAWPAPESDRWPDVHLLAVA